MPYIDEKKEKREYQANRRARFEERKRQKQRQEQINRMIRYAVFIGVPALILIVAIVVIIVVVVSSSKKADKQRSQEVMSSEIITEEYGERPHPDSAHVEKTIYTEHPYMNRNEIVDGMIQVGDVKFKAGYTASRTSKTIYPSEDYSTSLFSILINESTGDIIAARDEKTRMYPASMTKVMTLLVAVENVKKLDDIVYVSQEAADYSYTHDGSAVNWSVGEKLTVKDLLYGTILSSGADASYDLAVYVAGSEEEFVKLMNAKVEELGLSATTHFTNCAGFYNDNHYTTAYDMAMIMKAAMENDLCREIMSAHKYTTPETEQHPEGILISNWFLRRIEDKDSGGFVMCAKTGFVNQSGNCAVSYMISDSGEPYICVTGQAHSAWRAIYDHVGLYFNYTK